jgi:hypothetical protein
MDGIMMAMEVDMVVELIVDQAVKKKLEAGCL